MNQPFIKCKIFWKEEEKTPPSSFKTIRDEFPFTAGILICPQCGKQLTALSFQRENGVLYPYYHCSRDARKDTIYLVNKTFLDLLQIVQPKPNSIKLFSRIAKDKLKDNNTSGKQNWK